MDGQTWATLLSACAATIAVVLAAFSLRVTGRREHLSWVRSALEGIFVESLNASYDHVEACKHIGQLRRGEQSHRPEAAWLDIAADAHSVMIRSVTRLRVLTSDKLAKLALELHERSDVEMEILDAGDVSGFFRDRQVRGKEFEERRSVFIAEAQRLLGITK